MMKYALALLLCLSASAHAVEFTIVTVRGYVSFAVPDEWRVLTMQTKPPVSVAAFQVFNPADAGTRHSTNVAISVFDVESERGKQAMTIVGRRYGAQEPVVTSEGDWTVYSQQHDQGDMQYAVVDAKKQLADVVVAVRFAWPHLPNNPPQYDREMQEAFRSVLASVKGGLGRPAPREGEVIRRPVQ
jgi:hypothetical protein